MNIGLVQVDGKLPNLALMKICAFHEAQGHHVEWFKGDLFANEYDKVYASKIFKFSTLPPLPETALIGGTGIDFFNRLPDEIENATPSYSLYTNLDDRDNFQTPVDECKFHIGFSMKGCRFRCKFCCVPTKEGKPHAYNSIDEILINPKGGNQLVLLDNDFFGGANWRGNLERIIELNLKVNFNQGLNIRILKDEQAELLAACKYYNLNFNARYLTFAWDRWQDENLIFQGIERCERYGIKPENMQFFVLIGFDTTPEQDLERVKKLSDKGCLPFVMPYNKSDEYQRRFARWVNHRAIFKSVKWEDYGKNTKRNDSSLF